MLKKIIKISNLKYLVAFLLPLVFTLCINQGLDNDSWDVIAEGREIVENGIYYTDKLSMHEGLNITVQNYGFAVIFYYVFSIFGAAGIYFVMLILEFVVCFLLYKIYLLISKKNINLSLFLMSITGVVLVALFVTTRAQMLSYVIFLATIYFLEKFIHANEIKYLFPLPFLALLQINLHASLYLMLILVIGVYIVDSFRKPKGWFDGYRTKPLIIAGLTMLVCGLINPYGIKMITFIFTSYGEKRFQGMISELSAFSPFRNIYCGMLYLAIVFVFSLLILNRKEKVRIRYLLMIFGFLALGLNTIKGMSQFILVLMLPVAQVYKNIQLNKVINNRMAYIALGWAGALLGLMMVAVCPIVLCKIRNDPGENYVLAFDEMDRRILNSKKEIKLYSGYGDGAYAEYRGYRPYIDPRGEVFLKKNNGKEDILYEWADFIERKITTDEMIDKYQFDFILVSTEEDPFFNLEDGRYEMIFEQSGIRVFEKS